VRIEPREVKARQISGVTCIAIEEGINGGTPLALRKDQGLCRGIRKNPQAFKSCVSMKNNTVEVVTVS
jgi:hypothetical protein